MQESESKSEFRIGQRVHSIGDPRRIGTVKYVGPVQGYTGTWVGVDWDNGDGKHDGSVNGFRYFQAKGERSGSMVRTQNLSSGISLLEALKLRYRGDTSKEEEDEMYVLSASNQRVNVQLMGKDKIQDKLSRFEEMTGASLSFLGVSSPGVPSDIGTNLPNLKELDLTGNLLSEWKDVGIICKELPAVVALNLSFNNMSHDVVGMPLLKNVRVLVLNNTGISWPQVEILKHSLPSIEELHLMGNNISTIESPSSSTVQGFDSLRLLNLEDNYIADWKEILKLSYLTSLEQLHLNKNKLNYVFYPDDSLMHELSQGDEAYDKSYKPFQNLRCLLLGGNNIEDLASVASLNSFPKLMDTRLSDNPIADPARGGVARFVLIACLANVEILNGSEISPRERKDSEIRYIRLVMSKSQGSGEDIQWLHPRFSELKDFHGIDDEKSSVGDAAPQKMASGLLSMNLKICSLYRLFFIIELRMKVYTAVTLKCIGASFCEKAPLTKKLPGTTTVGKLKILCESFFKLKSINLKLFLQEEGSPLPILLDDEMASLLDVGVGNESTILVDEEN